MTESFAPSAARAGEVLLFTQTAQIGERLALQLASIPGAHEQVVVHDEPAFRAALRLGRYGLIVVEDDALDLARALAPDTPVVAVTQRRDEQWAHALLRAGASEVLQWPALQKLGGLVADLQRKSHRGVDGCDDVRLLPGGDAGDGERLLTLLSHELRAPLMPILAAVHLLERQDLSASIRELIAIIGRNAELEARLIDELLGLVALLQGGVGLARKPTRADGCLRQVVGQARAEALSAGLKFEERLQAPRAQVLADSGRLKQIAAHVLRNAIKFTPRGGSIQVGSKVCAGEYHFSVTDTGAGISAEAIGRIFSAFEQDDNSITRAYGGLGLGLAIARELARRHGGDLQVESEGPGRGSRFTLRVPELELCPKGLGAGRLSAEARGLSVLLVEDNQDTREAMQRLLRLRGHEVTAVSTCSGGLHHARHGVFDLLIGDLGLPDGDGTEVARVFTRVQRAPSIAVTGYRDDDDIHRCHEAGFTAHVAKPVNFERLSELMEVLTRTSRPPA